MNAAQFNALIKKARMKDEYATEILYKYCLNVITMHLSFKFNNRGEVDDWAHDVVAKILSNLPDKFILHPAAWLHKVSDNYVFTMLKKQKRVVELLKDVSNNGHFESIVNKMTLEETLKELDELTVQILVLNTHFGYTFEEIGKILKIEPATARKRASRARQKLKEKEKEKEKENKD